MRYLLIATLSVACLTATAQTKKKAAQKPPVVESAPAKDKPAQDDATGIDPGTGTPLQTPQPPQVYNFVEQMPSPGFDLGEYLSTNMMYPIAAKKANIQGRVTVRFIVTEDGSISDVTVIRGIGGGCDEEAARVIKAMPKWKPGKMTGKPVKVYYTQPITFRLTD